MTSSGPPRRWHSRGYLPHFDSAGTIQHITYHLFDSLPQEVVRRMEEELQHTPEEKQDIKRLELIHSALDAGYGSCVLRKPECAKIVQESFLFGDGSRYRLLEWCVMPNHVHVLIEQNDEWSLSKIIQSWKRHTARHINMLLRTDQSYVPLQESMKKSGTALWQKDYFDRFMRSDQHLQNVRNYIHENPVSAGLCRYAGDWLWSSAHWREGER